MRATSSVPFYFRQLAIVSALDVDHDGIISAAEIAAAPITLAALDTDHDGKLTADEQPANFPSPGTVCPGLTLSAAGRNHESAPYSSALCTIPRPGPPRLHAIHPVLVALDSDHNGEISASEILNASAMLRTLDANRDGTS